MNWNQPKDEDIDDRKHWETKCFKSQFKVNFCYFRDPRTVSYAASHDRESSNEDASTSHPPHKGTSVTPKRSPRSEYEYEQEVDRPANRPLLTREACSILCRHGQKRAHFSQVEKRKPKEGVLTLYKVCHSLSLPLCVFLSVNGAAVGRTLGILRIVNMPKLISVPIKYFLFFPH